MSVFLCLLSYISYSRKLECSLTTSYKIVLPLYSFVIHLISVLFIMLYVLSSNTWPGKAWKFRLKEQKDVGHSRSVNERERRCSSERHLTHGWRISIIVKNIYIFFYLVLLDFWKSLLFECSKISPVCPSIKNSIKLN